MEEYRKKIAIVTHQMVMGGIEKSLIELCRKLQEKNVEVTLYLEAEYGELYGSIPDGIKVRFIFKEYNSSKQIMKTFLKRKETGKVYSFIKACLINKLNGNPVKGWKETVNYLESNEEYYDYAFAYGAPIAFSTIYVIEKIKAKKKYAWIHNDPSQLSLDIVQYKMCFERYDKIICVSENTKKKFDNIFPEYSLKTKVFYNIINQDVIKEKANEKLYVDNFKGKRLLTVGRLCEKKGQDIIPEIMKKLLRDNYDVKWYCVGEGELHTYLNTLIEKEKLQDRVILIGNKNNPYPFFKMADIYVQPSRDEGFGITITEAKILGLPIIATDFDGASEQIEDGKTGIIVKFNIDEMYVAIKKMLDNEDLVENFKFNLKRDTNKCISDINELISLKKE